MITALLILHGLASIALIGAVTHQFVALLRANSLAAAERASGRSFFERYSRVGSAGFTNAIIGLFIGTVMLGAIIYPTYRLDVRVPFEEMRLFWAVGLFEIKEHWGGVGLGILPLYAYAFRPQNTSTSHRDRVVITGMLTLIVWGDLIAGHVLNNIRGLA